jgi:hypothetical protein
MALRKRLNEIIEIKMNITRREFLLLQKLSAENDMGPYEYAKNIVSNWITHQMLGQYRPIFNNMTIEELAEFFGDFKDDGTVNTETSAAAKLKEKVDKEKNK